MIPRRRPRFYQGEFKDLLKSIFQKKVAEGDAVEVFENKFAEYIGVKFAIATCSGRSAMELLLDSLGVKKGDEIIMPAYTLRDLKKIIEDKGLVPKFVDIEEDSFNINPNLIEGEVTKNTKAIIATHIFGLPCNIKKIGEIAQKHNLVVIEDCAHAVGAEIAGKKVGSFGAGAFFSLETTKLINTFGGGMVTTNNPAVNNWIRKRVEKYPVYPGKILKKIFFSYLEHLIIISPLYRLLNLLFMFKATTKIISKFYLIFHGRARVAKSRLANIQALFGLGQLRCLDQCNAVRNKIAAEFNKVLDGAVFPQKNNFTAQKRVYYFYTVNLGKINNLELLRKKLLVNGVDAGIKNEITDNCVISGKEHLKFPVVNKLFYQIIQLPIYDRLTQKDIIFISNKMKKSLSCLRR
jgi:dTDP-4-amino-4,6-dideoxygalactose transaminase